MQTEDQVLADIKSLKIQGATDIALTVLDALEQNPSKDLGTRLAYARPTEPLAQNAVRFVFSGKNVTERISQYKDLIEDSKHTILESGKQLLVDGGAYMTLCHSSTIVRLFESARKIGVYFSLYVAETRPRYQGRITARELLNAGFDDVTMIIDDVAVGLIEGRIGTIDALFIGADLLTEKGFVNKVGSLAVVAAAERHNVPVYVLSTLLKYDPKIFTRDKIEQRDPGEIWQDAPKKLKFYAPAFDYIPYDAGIRFVTEAGILTGDTVKETAQRLYPFIFS